MSRKIRYDEEPTPDVIEKLIESHKIEVERYERLQRYYEGKNDILNRKKKDPSKANNKLANAYPSYIVDVMQGYFIGKPVTYDSANEELMGKVQDIFNYNDEQDENSELAKMAGIKGKAYEIVYVDEESNLRFDEIDADNLIIVYNTNINPEVNFAIRYYNLSSPLDDKETLYVEVYTKDSVLRYKQDKSNLILEDEQEHYFNQVPIIEFLNNDEGISDFERVISLIDAYDKAQSDTANDFEEFTDAILVIKNMMGTTSEDIQQLKEDRAILTEGDGGVEWLIKQINDVALENYKNRLKSDIHKFSKVMDVSDEQFSNNASGIAMAYKTLSLEQVMAGKERKFKRALQKRLELITTFLNIKGGNYDYRDITLTFTRNKPVNVKEDVEVATMLRGFTSESTALSQLPMIDDVTSELEKIEKEREVYIDLDKIPLEDEADIKDEVLINELD